MQTSNDVPDLLAVSRMLDECVGEDVALLYEGEAVLFDEFADSVHFVADRLRSAGVTSMDRVGLIHGEGVRAAVALAALASIGASVSVSSPADLSDEPTAMDAHFLLADIAVEHVLDEVCGDVIPTVIAEDFALARVKIGDPCSRPEIVFFSDERVVRRSSTELTDDAMRVASEVGLGANSTVTVSESLSSPASLTVLFGSLLSGACVSLRDPIEPSLAPCVVAAGLLHDDVTVLAGSASYIESLVRCGVVGLLPLDSLTDIVVASGRIDDVMHGVLTAAMPSVRVTHTAGIVLAHA